MSGTDIMRKRRAARGAMEVAIQAATWVGVCSKEEIRNHIATE